MASAYDPRGGVIHDGSTDRELPSVSVCVGDFRLAINRLRQALGSGSLPSIHREKVHSMRAMLHTLHCASLNSNWVHSAMANDFARGLAALSELEQLQRQQHRQGHPSLTSPCRPQNPRAGQAMRNRSSDSDEDSSEDGEAGHAPPVMPAYGGGGVGARGGAGHGYADGPSISDALLAAQHALALLVVHYCESLRMELNKCQERWRVAADEGGKFQQRLSELQLALDENQAVMVSLATAHAEKQAAATRSEKEAQQLSNQLETTRKAMEYYSALTVALRAEVSELRTCAASGAPVNLAPIPDGMPVTAAQLLDSAVVMGTPTHTSSVTPERNSSTPSGRTLHQSVTISPAGVPRHLEADLGSTVVPAAAEAGNDVEDAVVPVATEGKAEDGVGTLDDVLTPQRITWGDSQTVTEDSTPHSMAEGTGVGTGGDELSPGAVMPVKSTGAEPSISPSLPQGEQLDRVPALRPLPLHKLRLPSAAGGVAGSGSDAITVPSRGSQTARPATTTGNLRAEDAVARAQELLAALPSDALDLFRQYARDAWDAATRGRQLASAPVTSRRHRAAPTSPLPGLSNGALRRHTMDADTPHGMSSTAGVSEGPAGVADVGVEREGLLQPSPALVGLRALIHDGTNDSGGCGSVDNSPSFDRDQHSTTAFTPYRADKKSSKVSQTTATNDTVALVVTQEDQVMAMGQQPLQNNQAAAYVAAVAPEPTPQPVAPQPASRALVVHGAPVPLHLQLMQSVNDVYNGVSQMCKGWVCITYGLWSMGVAVPWWVIRSLASNTQAGALGQPPFMSRGGRVPRPPART